MVGIVNKSNKWEHRFKMLKKLAARGAHKNRIDRALRAAKAAEKTE